MRSLRIESPAKLNLTLRILGRRRDGYHDLVTLFHRISLKDSLFLKKADRGFRLTCRHPGVPQKNNLVTRAYELLRGQFPRLGVNVRLVKRIPIGGGLGGGSSNAAAFLLGANRLFRLGLSRKDLMKLGARLGSDVPFFISESRHAIGERRGEAIHPLHFQKRLWFLLFPSRKGLSTHDVYQGYHAPRERPSLTRLRRDAKIASAFLEKGRFRKAAGFLINDLLESAEKMRPSLKKRRETLTRLQLGMCQMSGSGPTQFMIFSSRHQALRAMRQSRRPRSLYPLLVCHSD